MSLIAVKAAKDAPDFIALAAGGLGRHYFRLSNLGM
jgi:hypothetical protein